MLRAAGARLCEIAARIAQRGRLKTRMSPSARAKEMEKWIATQISDGDKPRSDFARPGVTRMGGIAAYEKLLNSLAPDEAAVFLDAAHPTHAARPEGCWAPAKEVLAIEQTSGRQRVNIHGAIDLETGKTATIDLETVDAASTIRLLEAIEAMCPLPAMIHVFLDTARYHHAKLVQERLAQPGRRIELHFVPVYCPHLNPIERLWGVMREHLTHDKSYATHREFAEAALTFLREIVPKWRPKFYDSIVGHIPVINPKDF